MDLPNLMNAATVLLLAGFIPILAIISVFARTRQAKQKLDAARALYDLDGDRYLEMYRKQKQPDLWKQVWFPILVMFLMGVFFAAFTVFTDRVITAPAAGARLPGPSNLLMLGPRWTPATLPDGAQEAYGIGTAVTVTFAYLGWYVWSIATIFSRFSTLELVAGTYMNVMIRLVMAVLLAILLRHLSAVFYGTSEIISPVAIGFGVGVFPDTALSWISRKLRSRLLGEVPEATDAPLDLIQGVSAFRKLRLFEIGMDNCQNLAECNPIQLFVTSNLGLLEVLDWVGQAQLAVLVGPENFAKLQKNGWRRARDFVRAVSSPAKPVLSALLGYPESQLEDLSAGLRGDQNYHRVEALLARIERAEATPHPAAVRAVAARVGS